MLVGFITYSIYTNSWNNMQTTQHKYTYVFSPHDELMHRLVNINK